MSKQEIEELKRKRDEKLKELDKKLEQVEQDYLNSISNQITRPLLNVGIWKIRHLLRDRLGLIGKKKDFPVLARLLKGVNIFDHVEITVDDVNYGIFVTDDEILVNGMENYNSEVGDFVGNTDIIPLINTYNLRVNFDEVEKYIEYEENWVRRLRANLERVKRTQLE